MEDGPFRMEVIPEGDGTRVVLTGEFDTAAVPEFTNRIASVEASEPPRIVLDLSRLSFMDSQGLRAILEIHDRSEKNDRRLTLIPGPPAVQRVFQITGTEARLPFADP